MLHYRLLPNLVKINKHFGDIFTNQKYKLSEIDPICNILDGDDITAIITV